MIDIIAKMECTGCKACKDVCPAGAISYTTDREGFWYPKVDGAKCIRCQKCIHICPSLVGYTNPGAKEPKVYAAWALEDGIRLKGTSGGVFYILAREMLRQGGVVAACKYTADYKAAYHDVGSTRKDLEGFVGSKYFQSDTEGVYKKVGEFLEGGRGVLFCGAPCQVAGLNQYIGAGATGLLTVDFICRGVNSPMAFRRYVDGCERKYKSKVKVVRLKDKRKGWTRLGTYMEFENGKSYYRDRVTDPWVNGFIRGDLFMRPCCSQCKYKERLRVADISIGDFWGLRSTPENLYKGISAILANTDKGIAYIQAVKGEVALVPHTYEEVLKGNGCLRSPAPMGKHRDAFFEGVGHSEFEPLVWKLLGETKRRLFIKELAYSIRAIIKRR